MTLRYAHLSEDHTRQAIERLIPGETGTRTSTTISEIPEVAEIKEMQGNGGGVWESIPPLNENRQLMPVQNSSHGLGHDCFRIQTPLRAFSIVPMSLV